MEIKFRAWVDGTMKYDDVVIRNGMYFSLETKWNIHSVQPEVPLMQYIGQKDKNGKEIYVGDICDTHTFEFIAGVETDSRQIAEVQYDKEAAMFVFKTKKYGDYIYSEFSDDGVEVIGNIYQNPELLK